MSVQWEHCHLLRTQSAAAEIGAAGCLGPAMSPEHLPPSNASFSLPDSESVVAAPGTALKNEEMDLIPASGAAESFSDCGSIFLNNRSNRQ
jgi:hypothetical protein